jgi:hypothetical protein
MIDGGRQAGSVQGRRQGDQGEGGDKERIGRNGRHVISSGLPLFPIPLVPLPPITILPIVFLTVNLIARAILLPLNAGPLARSEFTA